MAWYEIFKDTLKLAQTVNNAELYDKMMELRGMMSDMQDDIDRLKDENKSYINRIQELEKIRVTELDIEYYPNNAYITLKSDQQKIKYCGVCWGKDQKLIPIPRTFDRYHCSLCGSDWLETGDSSTLPTNVSQNPQK
ncbi:hypothetical protein [Methanocorpusculum parvum]|uniref:Transcriptional regulator n=1 Tax=Methanocorpusculum parvum TaxID=2193 RepID=A0AAX0Q7K3_9EURY|nr:hypothetical protein [Methanocorpusculum parvum]PAV08753.1 hypothetical protein ASJ83_00035 [Methanocorpusculum parvum]